VLADRVRHRLDRLVDERVPGVSDGDAVVDEPGTDHPPLGREPPEREVDGHVGDGLDRAGDVAVGVADPVAEVGGNGRLAFLDGGLQFDDELSEGRGDEIRGVERVVGSDLADRRGLDAGFGRDVVDGGGLQRLEVPERPVTNRL